MSNIDKGLRTERLIIRNPRPSDHMNWFRLFSDRKNLYYLPEVCIDTPEESKAMLDEALAEVASPAREKYFFCVELADSGDYIGDIGYTVEAFTPIGKIVHAGYFYLPEYHNKGYATEALRELLRFAFVEGGVCRFKTGLFAENIASERVMQKCGLIKEGLHKEAAWLDGRLRDRLSYRLLRHEWENK